MEVQELIIGFGLKIDDKSLENIKKIELGLRGLTDIMSSTGRAFTGGQGIKDFFVGTAEAAQELDNLAYSLGWSVEKVQDWQAAINALGHDSDAVFGDIVSLVQDVRFNMSENQIINLMDRLRKATPQYRTELQKVYGISNAFVNMSAKGSQEFRKLLKTVQSRPKLGREDIDALEGANNSIKEITQNFDKMSQSIISNAAPRVAELTKKFGEFIDEHPEGTVNAITAAIGLLGAASVINVISTVAGGFMKLTAAIKGTAAAAALLGAIPGKLSGLSSLPFLGAIGKMGWFGAGISGATLAGQSIKNLFSDTYEDTWLDKLAKAAVDPLMEKIGLERGFANKWFEDNNKINLPSSQNGFPNQMQNSNLSPLGRAMNTTNFSGTTININTTEPIGNVLNGVGNTVLGVPLDQSSFGTSIYN